MRATEIIRGVLDLIDRVDCIQQEVEPTVTVTVSNTPDEVVYDDGPRRFRQIFDILSQKDDVTMYSNSPNETVASPASVTTDAGGGVNGPKHPSDIRSDSVSMYPNFQAGGR
jgi:hypothetical protein